MKMRKIALAILLLATMMLLLNGCKVEESAGKSIEQDEDVKSMESEAGEVESIEGEMNISELEEIDQELENLDWE